jgi:enoyl-CoA hydratase/carnithine racemase
LNRPEKLNALSYELHRELDQELTLIENEQGVDVVILTGAGDRAFSSGGDIPQMASTTAEELAARREFHSKATWHIATFAKPIIGAINGLAYGGGAMLSSMLDIRIGCDRTAFRFLAVRYGRVNSTWTLPLMVGMAKAKELLYTGRVVEAKEAERIGLLNQLVPSEKLLDTAIEMARLISENDAPTVQGIKRLLHEEIGMGWRDRYDHERNARTTWLRPNHPRESFKEFLTRKGIQT